MTPRRLAVAAAAAVLAALLSACARRAEHGAASPAGKPVIGLVFDVGGRGDKSFNDQAYTGLERARRELGITFQTIETGEGAEREAALRQLAAGEARLVFGVGFLFTDDIRKLALEFPNKQFACVDYTLNPGDRLPPNLTAIRFKEEEGSFLVGALAGLVTKTGKVGFVGGMQTPLIRKFEAGYVAGVRATHPGARVIIKYAGTTGSAFKDPTKGKELALAEYHQGADVIYHAAGATGRGVFEAAREKGRLAIGVDSDQHDEAPGHILTSMVKRVDLAVFKTIREVVEGRGAGGVQVLGLAEEGVSWVNDHRNQALIPLAARATVDSLRAEIIAGRIVPPTE